MPKNPYIKTLQDELDLKLLDQLHTAVVQISGFCFEIKKFCVTTLSIVIALVAKFSLDKLDHSIFVSGIVISVCFWFLDATAYFYQVKLRGMMDAIRFRLASCADPQLVLTAISQTIEPSRVSVTKKQRVLDAIFNHSMWLYVLLIVIDISLWIVYCTGHIK